MSHLMILDSSKNHSLDISAGTVMMNGHDTLARSKGQAYRQR